jgi:hypothetical protein
MKNVIKRVLFPITPNFILNPLKRIYQKQQLKEWEKGGRPLPPPHLVKQRVIAEYQQKSGISTLIETGTYMGDMIEAQKGNFKKIFSVELSEDLCQKARIKFKRDKNVTIVHGDSGKVMPEVLKKIDEPAIFWLDGHYSSGVTARGDTDCPIFGELEAILASGVEKHILLVDDARLFNGQGDYPTIDAMTQFILDRNPSYRAEVKDDIVRYES